MERECIAFNHAVLAEVPRLIREERLGAVLVAGRWLPDPTAAPRLGRMVQAWGGQGLQVVLAQDIADFDRDVPACLSHLDPARCDQSRAEAEAARTRAQAPLLRLAAEHPWLRLWDPLPAVCGQERCPVQDAAGRVLYRDNNHLSEAGSRPLAPSLQALLESLRAKTQPLRQ